MHEQGIQVESTGTLGDAAVVAHPPSATTWIVFLIITMLMLHTALWLTGARGSQLAIAVERGAAQVETNLRGEVAQDEALQTIRLQNDSLGFWMALAGIRDFVIDPTLLVVRTLLVTLVGAAAITLARREFRWNHLMMLVARWQAVWVLGLGVLVLLNQGLGRPADISLRLLLPAGEWPAPLWIAMGDLSLLAVAGWVGITFTLCWRCGASTLITIPLLALVLIGEWGFLTLYDLVLEAGMRSTLIS